MLNIILWILFGALAGWIGFLADRSPRQAHMRLYVSVGVIGAIIGGLISHVFGVSAGSSGAIDTTGVFNAIFTSALSVTVFVALWNFLGRTSSS